jgi:hypothetical protein
MTTLIRKKIALAGAGAAGVIALGLAVPTLAFAQDGPTPTPSNSSSADSGQPAGRTWPGKADRDQKRAERQNQLAEGLAKELGIPQDKVTAALEKVQGQLEASAKADREAQMRERLSAAVSAGKITQEQADAIAAAAAAGVLPGGGFGHGPDRPGR